MYKFLAIVFFIGCTLADHYAGTNLVPAGATAVAVTLISSIIG